ncbi:hypothetical protein X781_13600 [Mannheimia sp. USDA-ARS-USMARC-1261]|nr:hypothetical protein X781_13600 [Mannheimia sp. USDA-ARS-USMARC-1261]
MQSFDEIRPLVQKNLIFSMNLFIIFMIFLLSFFLKMAKMNDRSL